MTIGIDSIFCIRNNDCMQQKSSAWYCFLIEAAFFLYLFLLFSQKIDLTTADLGRHIKNGEIFVSTHKVISTNTYSYTQPDFPVVTHHWGAGVIFYILWKIGGFQLISFIYSILSACGVFLFSRIAKRNYGWIPALISVFLTIPLFVYRTEIRPEGISFLFLGIYWYLLTLFSQGRLKFGRLLLLIIFLQILWVNTHIFFVFGPLIAFVYYIQSLFDKKLDRRYMFILFIGTLFSALLNPFFLKGALTPFTILGKSGYMIAENQSILFMQSRFNDYIYLHVEFLTFVAVLGFIGSLRQKEKIRSYLSVHVMTVFFLLLSWNTVRAIPLFGYFVIIFLSSCLKPFFEKIKPSADTLFSFFGIAIGIIVLLIISPTSYSPFYKRLGFGLAEGVNTSADFFKDNQLHGPIFNNYDIGSYLIYHLYPNEKVFVDNRPEEYSVSFFKDIYIPLQENESVWENLQKEYKFNVIFFYRRDFTPWAQPFLIRRIKDHLWVPVYVDMYTIILVKNTPQNQSIIQRYRLPESMFVTKS